MSVTGIGHLFNNSNNNSLLYLCAVGNPLHLLVLLWQCLIGALEDLGGLHVVHHANGLGSQRLGHYYNEA